LCGRSAINGVVIAGMAMCAAVVGTELRQATVQGRSGGCCRCDGEAAASCRRAAVASPDNRRKRWDSAPRRGERQRLRTTAARGG
jgi:hypothetical protein